MNLRKTALLVALATGIHAPVNAMEKLAQAMWGLLWDRQPSKIFVMDQNRHVMTVR